MLVKAGLSPFTALLGALHNRQLGIDALHDTLKALVPLFGDAEAHIAAVDFGALQDLRHWLTQADVQNHGVVVVLLWQLLHRLLSLFEARLAFVREVDGIDLILDGLMAAKPPIRLAAARAMRRLAEAPDTFNDLLKPKKVLGRLLVGLFDADPRVACEISASLASLLPYRPTAAALTDYKQMLALLESAPSADEKLIVARCLWNVSNCAEVHDFFIDAGAVEAATPLLSSANAKIATAGAGILMALAISLRGKNAACDSPTTIALLCDTVQHHADDRLRANAAIALRHICELDAALAKAGAELFDDPAILRQVLGSRATAAVINQHIADGDAKERIYGALRVLIEDVDGCEAAFGCLNIFPYMIKDVEQGDKLALSLVQWLATNCGQARAHLDSILRKREGDAADAGLIETLMAHRRSVVIAPELRLPADNGRMARRPISRSRPDRHAFRRSA